MGTIASLAYWVALRNQNQQAVRGAPRPLQAEGLGPAPQCLRAALRERCIASLRGAQSRVAPTAHQRPETLLHCDFIDGTACHASQVVLALSARYASILVLLWRCSLNHRYIALGLKGNEAFQQPSHIAQPDDCNTHHPFQDWGIHIQCCLLRIATSEMSTLEITR